MNKKIDLKKLKLDQQPNIKYEALMAIAEEATYACKKDEKYESLIIFKACLHCYCLGHMYGKIYVLDKLEEAEAADHENTCKL